MPIEIRELVIKAVVTSASQQPVNNRAPGEDEKNKSIQRMEETIENIMEILKNKDER